MKESYYRLKFTKTSAVNGIGMSIAGSLLPLFSKGLSAKGKRVDIIGLDTSLSIEFTEETNSSSDLLNWRNTTPTFNLPKFTIKYTQN